jgi:diguanylate cyclase (GGDEF)-like protein
VYQAGSAWLRSHRGLPLPATVGLVAMALAALGLVPLPLLVEARLSWIASLLFSVATLLAARRTARRFWWAIGVNACAIGTGYLIQLVTTTSPAHVVAGPVTLVLGGLGVLALIAVMLSYPMRIDSRRARFCFWLDMATVMVGAGAFGWYLSDPGDDVRSGILTILTGPVVMLVAVFAIAKLLIAGRPPFSLWPGVLGACAAATGGLLAVAGPSLVAQGHGGWYFALSALGDAFMTIAAWTQCVRIESQPDALERRRRHYSALPYVALAGTFALLSVALSNRGLDARTWTVLGGAVFSTGLVVMRQLASFAENAHLLGELDDKVRELHETEAVLRAALHERDALAGRLHDMAFYDSLTGLANRSLFQDELTAALGIGRGEHGDVVVMLLDLDDFKPINDRFGHAAGDEVLCEVARRLRDCVRRSDTVARLGGDEFAVILHDPLPSCVTAVAQRILTAVSRPCRVGGVPMSVGVSIGLASNASADGGGDGGAERLLRHADDAMYQAKRNGKNSFRVYGESAPAEDPPEFVPAPTGPAPATV